MRKEVWFERCAQPSLSEVGLSKMLNPKLRVWFESGAQPKLKSRLGCAPLSNQTSLLRK